MLTSTYLSESKVFISLYRSRSTHYAGSHSIPLTKLVPIPFHSLSWFPFHSTHYAGPHSIPLNSLCWSPFQSTHYAGPHSIPITMLVPIPFRSLSWSPFHSTRYMDQFPVTSSHVLFEKSATYFTHPQAPLRVYTLLPEAKLIVILHDPIKRAYSWYQVCVCVCLCVCVSVCVCVCLCVCERCQVIVA